MRLESLAEFCMIAKTLSFSTAAEHLYVTEAALSRHIKKLENEVGGPLFYRTTRRVSLTPLGKVFLPYAQRGLLLKSELEAAVSAQLFAEKTVLTVAAIQVANYYIDLPALLSEFNVKNPNIQVNFITPNSPASDPTSPTPCEISFIPELFGYEDPAFNRVLIRKDKILALIPKQHPLTCRKALNVEDLKDEQLLLISNGSPLFNVCNQICKNRKFQPRVILTLSSGSNIRSIVEQDVGIGLLLAHPSAKIHTDFPIGDKSVFMDFEEPIYVDFNIVYRSDLSPAGKMFLSFVKKSIAEGSFLL